jgi:hypothetical protein
MVAIIKDGSFLLLLEAISSGVSIMVWSLIWVAGQHQMVED